MSKTLKTKKASKPIMILGDEVSYFVYTDKHGDKHTVSFKADHIQVGFDISAKDKAKMPEEEQNLLNDLGEAITALMQGDIEPLVSIVTSLISEEVLAAVTTQSLDLTEEEVQYSTDQVLTGPHTD